MTQIILTHQAIRELRDLRPSMNNRVIPGILAELQENQPSGLVEIAKDVVRYRRMLGSGGYLRLALDHSNYPNDWCVIAAGLRREGDFNDFYNRNFDALPRVPCYEWNGETGIEWDSYINGGYHHSPVVSEQQRADAQAATPQSAPYQEDPIGFHALITQSPPGTGKTVTAADKACKLLKSEYYEYPEYYKYDEYYEVIFLLPKVLIKQVLEYRCTKQAMKASPERFFIGTFHQWLQNRFPELPVQVISPDEELKRLQKAAKRYHWSTRGYKPITPRDVLLYQIYIANSNSLEDSIYQDNQERIKELSNIRVSWWQEEFNPHEKCRFDYAIAVLDYLKENAPKLNSDVSKTLIIIDEAQDYLLDEIEILKYLCCHWQQIHNDSHSNYNYSISLWLLGDLNQRIIPVDFNWGALHLNGEKETDWPDYRTTQRILTLANQFQFKAHQINRSWQGQWLPKATDPERCFKKPGELIKMIVYPDLEAAESFLQPLIDIISQKMQMAMNDWELQHSLEWRLAKRARVFCSDHYHVTTELRGTLEFMPVSQAKGREFDSCIAFCIFDLPENYGQLEAYTKWYTQLTRSRERLLIVTTESQLAKIGEEIFNNATITHPETQQSLPCIERINPYQSEAVQQALNWVTEFSNGLHFSETESIGLIDILLSDLNQPYPILYIDLYSVLGNYGLQRNKIIDIECQMVEVLFDPKKTQALQTYLEQPTVKENIRLQALIYRGLGQSWQAASIAHSLRDSDPDTYQDIIQGIAQDLRSRKLIFEADRLLSSSGFDSSQAYQNLLEELLNQPSNNLIPLLRDWVRLKLGS